MTTFSDWMESHGLTNSDLQSWSVQYDDISNRLVIPSHTPGGKFVFDIFRNFQPDLPTYEYQPAGCRTGLTLYGLYRQVQKISDSGYVVVTEGFSDALALYARLDIPAVSSLASQLSSVQRRLLQRLGVQVIVLGDGDEAGEAFARKSAENGMIGLVIDTLDPAECIGLGKLSILSEAISTSVLEPNTSFMKRSPTGAVLEIVERPENDAG